MDALDLLISDHNRVKELFEQIVGERGMQQKRLLFENIRNDLDTHSYVEETVIYPTFRKFPELAAFIDQSLAEHVAVKSGLEELDRLNVDHPGFDSRLAALINDVLGHIQKEESELFPEIRRIMKRLEREQLGRHVSAAKQERQEKAA